MLINFPKTDINLKSDGGITPLMDAVKTTNIYMVKQLVKKNADISIADYEGLCKLHCDSGDFYLQAYVVRHVCGYA